MPTDATRLRSGAVEACEFFLPGGPAGVVNLPDQKQLDKQQAGKPQEVSPGWGVQQGDTRAAAFGPWPEGGGSCWAGFAYFSYLMLNVEELCISGRPVYPVERCLLVSHTPLRCASRVRTVESVMRSLCRLSERCRARAVSVVSI